MKIIISPTKKMKMEEHIAPRTLPIFLEESRILHRALCEMSPSNLQKLWGCQDKIAQENVIRLGQMRFNMAQSPAILSYQGLQFQSMKPQVFTGEQWDYVHSHLRILSGFYGVLRPWDSVAPYRLEMQAKLAVGEDRNLYDFWGRKLADALMEEEGAHPLIINLASLEYSKAVRKHLPPEGKIVHCHFKERKNGTLRVQATHAKMARGEMVAYLAEIQGECPQDLKGFARNGYRFSAELSTETDREWNYVFIQEGGVK